MGIGRRIDPSDIILQRINRILTDPHVAAQVSTDHRRVVLEELLVLLKASTPIAGLREVVQKLEIIRRRSIAFYRTRAELDEMLTTEIKELSSKCIRIEPGMAVGMLEDETFFRTL